MIPPKGISWTEEEYNLNFKKYIKLQENEIKNIAISTGVKLVGRINHPENYSSSVITLFDDIGDEICLAFQIGALLHAHGLNFNITYTSDISECIKLIENYKVKKEESKIVKDKL
tara:strand:+ start:373 stop:717 length:345 start_codon:yes stop_codon:yes gene_type:complete